MLCEHAGVQAGGLATAGNTILAGGSSPSDAAWPQKPDWTVLTQKQTNAALDALLDFGRPAKVELCVLIDRRFSRQLPIQPDYTGRSIDSIVSQKVKVFWKERDGKEEVVLL